MNKDEIVKYAEKWKQIEELWKDFDFDDRSEENREELYKRMLKYNEIWNLYEMHKIEYRIGDIIKYAKENNKEINELTDEEIDKFRMDMNNLWKEITRPQK